MSDLRGTRTIPCHKRKLFKEPIGTLITENDLKKISKKGDLITVGDVVSLTVNSNGITPRLSVYDGMTERREMTGFASFAESKGWEPVSVTNPAGTITAELVDAIRNALSHPGSSIIRVNGEEDMATLPCILLSENGTNVIYGWPGKGMMLVTADDIIKKKMYGLWEQTEETQ